MSHAIDRSDGALTFNAGFRLAPYVTRSDLLQGLGDLPVNVDNGAFRSYLLYDQQLGDESFFTTIFFFEEKLESITLEHRSDGFDYNAWLRQQGAPAGVCDWGEIWTGEDSHYPGARLLIIRYSFRGEPWPTRQEQHDR